MMKTFSRTMLCIISIAGIVCSGFLFKHSMDLKLPEKYVYVSSLSSAYRSSWDSNTGAEYLGGDAYNYMVEASLKAGYYNAVSNEKTTALVGSALLFFISAYVFFYILFISHHSAVSDRQTAMLEAIAENTKNFQPAPAPVQAHEPEQTDP